MITTDELRRNNYLYLNGDLCRVQTIFDKYLDVELMCSIGRTDMEAPLRKRILIDNFAGVAFTKEIMVKYGFYEVSFGGVEIHLKEEIFMFYSFGNEYGTAYINLTNKLGTWPVSEIPCKSFHKLQNFYFEYTGKELTLNK